MLLVQIHVLIYAVLDLCVPLQHTRVPRAFTDVMEREDRLDDANHRLVDEVIAKSGEDKLGSLVGALRAVRVDIVRWAGGITCDSGHVEEDEVASVELAKTACRIGDSSNTGNTRNRRVEAYI